MVDDTRALGPTDTGLTAGVVLAGVGVLIVLVLAVVVAVVLDWGVWAFILALMAIIMIHEAGHFLAAKLLGFKATKFFLGFGPTLWSTTRGETEYGVKALPLGGFVKIVGMNPYEELPPEDQPRSYTNKPRWQRAIVILAGPATHWITAFVILVTAAMAVGFPTEDVTTQVAQVQREIDGTASPAFQAGIRTGDDIVGFNGRRTEDWVAIRNFIRAHPGDTVSFQIERDGVVRTEEVTLGLAIVTEEGELVDYAPPGGELREPEEGEQFVGFLGLSPKVNVTYVKESIPGAFVEGGRITWDATAYTTGQIGNVFSQLFDGRFWSALTGETERRTDGPVGLVGAGRLADQTVESGNYIRFVELLLGLTISLGLMNLLPLVPLDGGHLAVIAYEGVTRRAVDMRKLIPIAAAVISFFVILFIAVLYLDLARPLEVPL